MLLQTLDDPPGPGQVRSWAQTRTLGYKWYVWRGVLLLMIFILVIEFSVTIILFWLFPEGRDLFVKIVPDVRAAIEQAGLDPNDASRFLDHLANALGSAEYVAKLRKVPALPGFQEYRTVLGQPGKAEVFRLVFTVVPECCTVVIVNCSRHSVRTL